MRSFWLLAISLTLLASPAGSHGQPGRSERPFIDLDGDGTTDLTIKRTPAYGTTYFDDGNRVSTSVHMSHITPERSNEIAAKNHSFLALFGEGELIGKEVTDSVKWTRNRRTLYEQTSFSSRDSSSTTWKGYKPNKNKKYLGVKLVTREGTHYGWIHVHIDHLGNVSIKASDYNTKTGQPIRAGARP